jgi:hypothetical protein
MPTLWDGLPKGGRPYGNGMSRTGIDSVDPSLRSVVYTSVSDFATE